MSMIGADVAELRKLADQFNNAADQIQQITTRLTAQINSTAAWQGNDAGRFKSTWNGTHRAQLASSMTALHDGAKSLVRNANEQEQASNGAGGTVPGSGGEGGGEKGGDEGGLLDKIDEVFEKLEQNPFWQAREWAERVGTVSKTVAFLHALQLGDAGSLLAVLNGDKIFKATDAVTNGVEYLTGGKLPEMLGSLGERLSNVGDYANAINKAGDTISAVAEKIGPFAKGLGIAGGAIGVISGGIGLYQGISSGNVHKSVDGGLDMVSGGLGIAAAVTPPPADVICGAAALGVWGGKEIYDHWDDITHFAGDVGSTVEHAGASVVHGAEHLASDAGHAVTHVLSDLNPF